MSRRIQTHVVLVSGGADSATVLAMAHGVMRREKQEGFESKVVCFHCNYGQKTEERELASFKKLCEHFGIEESDQFVIDIGFLKQIGKSSLTDESVDIAQDGHAIENKYVPTSYVPFRNGNLLSIAGSIAAAYEATDIWCGVVQEDSSGYPDCRVEFIANFEVALNCGLPDGVDVVLHAPLVGMRKEQIINAGTELGVPYEHTWSCYKNNDKACGLCDSCRLRVASFARLESVDPIEYQDGWDKALENAQVAI